MLPKVQCECGAVFTYGEPHVCGRPPKASASAKPATPVKAEKLAKVRGEIGKPATDRKAYQRELMRARRAAKRSTKADQNS